MKNIQFLILLMVLLSTYFIFSGCANESEKRNEKAIVGDKIIFTTDVEPSNENSSKFRGQVNGIGNLLRGGFERKSGKETFYGLGEDVKRIINEIPNKYIWIHVVIDSEKSTTKILTPGSKTTWSDLSYDHINPLKIFLDSFPVFEFHESTTLDENIGKTLYESADNFNMESYTEMKRKEFFEEIESQ